MSKINFPPRLSALFLMKYSPRNASEDFLSLDPLGVGSDEMLVGRAGYLAGCLWLQLRMGCQVEWKRIGRVVFSFSQVLPEPMLFKLSDLIVECGRRSIKNFPFDTPTSCLPRFSRKTSSKSPLMYQYYETQVNHFFLNLKYFFLLQYLGAGHGLTGILQILLSVPGYFQVILVKLFKMSLPLRYNFSI